MWGGFFIVHPKSKCDSWSSTEMACLDLWMIPRPQPVVCSFGGIVYHHHEDTLAILGICMSRCSHSFRRKTWKGTYSCIEVKIPVLFSTQLLYLQYVEQLLLLMIYVHIPSVYLSVPLKQIQMSTQNDKISIVSSKVEPSVGQPFNQWYLPELIAIP